MIVTVVEARVSAEKHGALCAEFERVVAHASSVLVQTMLLRCARDGEWWCIAAIQTDDDAFEEEVYEPGSIDIFRSVGIEPTSVSHFRIVDAVERPAGVISIES